MGFRTLYLYIKSCFISLLRNRLRFFRPQRLCFCIKSLILQWRRRKKVSADQQHQQRWRKNRQFVLHSTKWIESVKKMYETFISNGWLTEKKLYINRTKKQTVRDKAELKVKRNEEKNTMWNIRTLASPWRFQFTWWFSHFCSLFFLSSRCEVSDWVFFPLFIYSDISHFDTIPFSSPERIMVSYRVQFSSMQCFQLTALVMVSKHTFFNRLSVNSDRDLNTLTLNGTHKHKTASISHPTNNFLNLTKQLCLYFIRNVFI